jgi:hypothetical protein
LNGTEVWRNPTQPDQSQKALDKPSCLPEWRAKQDIQRQARLNGGVQTITGSNQIGDDPRRFKLSL